MSQAPRGPEKMFCPYIVPERVVTEEYDKKGKLVSRKETERRRPMSETCDTCPMWQQFRGTDANSGKEVDEWRCGLAMIPRLQIETSLHVRQTSAATESFRNEVVKRADAAHTGAPNLPGYNPIMIEAD